MDTCGFPKDNFYYYQAWWSGQDVLHILPHWNWAGKDGQNVDVWVYSNLDEVELFLNGKSLGRKTMPKDSHLEWEVPYQPGTLEARGYRKGQVVKTEKIETTGPAAKLVLTPDRSVIDANGEDVSVLTISAVDSKGRQVPVADNDVSFQVTGGKLIGVGNGNPSSHENDQFLPVDLDINTNAWRINLSPPKDLNPLLAPDYDDSDWKTTVTTGQADQLGPDSTAVFRSTFDMPGIEKGSKVTIKVGQIADRGSIYINGIRVGGTDRRDQSYSFDMTKVAHAGRNSIVVVVTSGTRDGGLGRTISAHLAGPPPVWRRQLFNGLAQAIVQGTPTPGTIKVTATSPGLQPATVEIEARPAEFRGF